MSFEGYQEEHIGKNEKPGIATEIRARIRPCIRTVRCWAYKDACKLRVTLLVTSNYVVTKGTYTPGISRNTSPVGTYTPGISRNTSPVIWEHLCENVLSWDCYALLISKMSKEMVLLVPSNQDRVWVGLGCGNHRGVCGVWVEKIESHNECTQQVLGLSVNIRA